MRLINRSSIFILLLATFGALDFFFRPVKGGFRIPPDTDTGVAGSQGNNQSDGTQNLHDEEVAAKDA